MAVGKQSDNHIPLDSGDYRTMCHTCIANKSQLVSSSTHFSVCSERLLVSATAIVLTASSDIPDKLDHWIADINTIILHSSFETCNKCTIHSAQVITSGTHLNVCNEWLVFKAITITLTASFDSLFTLSKLISGN